MAHIKLNQGLRRIEVSKLEIENDLAFEHFDRLPADQRDAEFVKALYHHRALGSNFTASNREPLSAVVPRSRADWLLFPQWTKNVHYERCKEDLDRWRITARCTAAGRAYIASDHSALYRRR